MWRWWWGLSHTGKAKKGGNGQNLFIFRCSPLQVLEQPDVGTARHKGFFRLQLSSFFRWQIQRNENRRKILRRQKAKNHRRDLAKAKQ